MIAIVDYNMGNLASVKNAFAKLGKETVVESDPDKFKNYDKIILPGVGAYGDAMEHLQSKDMVEAIQSYAKSGNYIFGICLGMQLLFESSEEFGKHEGLGIIKGHVSAFDSSKFSEPLKVPHMGWNKIKWQKSHPVFANLDPDYEYYFVHSYYVLPEDKDIILGTTFYGIEFPSVIGYKNLVAVQFHPEKSGKPGLQILKQFCEWNP